MTEAPSLSATYPIARAAFLAAAEAAGAAVDTFEHPLRGPEGEPLGIDVAELGPRDASTVVLVRVLTDNNVLHTTQGHIAVGWLIVEDIFTVLVLVVLPAAADILVDGAAAEGAAAGIADAAHGAGLAPGEPADPHRGCH